LPLYFFPELRLNSGDQTNYKSCDNFLAAKSSFSIFVKTTVYRPISAKMCAIEAEWPYWLSYHPIWGRTPNS